MKEWKKVYEKAFDGVDSAEKVHPKFYELAKQQGREEAIFLLDEAYRKACFYIDTNEECLELKKEIEELKTQK